MSEFSTIEWTNTTWNPVTGCTKVSQGCKNCYAERLWPKVEGSIATREGRSQRRPFTDVRCHPERLDLPLHLRKPRRIFVNSMSDLFHEDVPNEFIDEVFAITALAPQHTFQVLTKRPARMREYFANQPLPRRRWEDCIRRRHGGELRGVCPPLILPNLWLGVSIEDQATAEERIPLLLQTPAAIRWISAEPLLGPIDLLRWRIPGHQIARALSSGKGEPCLHWIVAGGESGPNARPSHPEWFRSLRDQCQAAGVPFFFKQWGEWRNDMDFVREKNLWDETRIRSSGYTKIEGYEDAFVKVRKKAAGRQLDGREWNEYPR